MDIFGSYVLKLNCLCFESERFEKNFLFYELVYAFLVQTVLHPTFPTNWICVPGLVATFRDSKNIVLLYGLYQTSCSLHHMKVVWPTRYRVMGIFLIQLNMQHNCIVLFTAENQHDLNVYTLIKAENRALSSVWNTLRNYQTTNLLCGFL